MEYFIGLDVGATKTEGVLLNEFSEVIVSEKIPTPKDKNNFLKIVFSLIEKLKTKKISGIGVGVPGQVIGGKIIRLHNLPKIKDLDLRKTIKKKFKVKTIVENDANCFAWGEALARKRKNLVGLTLGSGVGGGVIINRKIYRGKDGLAGEFGQIVYREGTYEDYCSGKFFEKNGFGKKSYEEYGFHLGNLIGAVINAINPEMIILGGSVSKSFDFFKKPMEKRLKESVTYPKLAKTKVVVAKTKHAGAIGAGLLFNNQENY